MESPLSFGSSPQDIEGATRSYEATLKTLQGHKARTDELVQKVSDALKAHDTAEAAKIMQTIHTEFSQINTEVQNGRVEKDICCGKERG